MYIDCHISNIWQCQKFAPFINGGKPQDITLIQNEPHILKWKWMKLYSNFMYFPLNNKWYNMYTNLKLVKIILKVYYNYNKLKGLEYKIKSFSYSHN